MPLATMFALDLAAISVLTFVLYFPRHRRKDMVVAYLGADRTGSRCARVHISTAASARSN